jgi:hypothetical protein
MKNNICITLKKNKDKKQKQKKRIIENIDKKMKNNNIIE